jgi:DNA-binding PadR family transcriptional regulator
MNRSDRKQQILEIIEEYPGSTGATIFLKIVERSKLAKWLGKDSLIAMLFTPSGGTIYADLYALEREGLIRSLWGIKAGDLPRRRHYFAIGDGND